MAKEKKEYEVYVNYIYGCDEIYKVIATSSAIAKRKAKAKFMKEYFKKSYIKTEIER